jgi:carboxypeptidase C (cathepsin A)
MRFRCGYRFALSWLALCVAVPGTAQVHTLAGSGFTEADGIVTTRHSITFGGRTLGYTARAGHIPIRVNDTGEVHGQMFFIAYTLDGASPSPTRPLTFLWNGGPGSSSSLVHLLGFGPMRLDAAGVVESNDGTWLPATDLVFIDPIGTGYSRPTKAEYGEEFFQNRGDAESIAEFIRVYLTRADAWDSPLYLAGESFGVGRAVRVAGVLQQKGTPVRGLMLIGLVPPLARVDASTRTALSVPTYAATAFYHKVLARDRQRDLNSLLESSKSWALEQYAPALSRRARLSTIEQSAIRTALAGFTGIAAANIDSSLTVRMDRFTHQLLGSRGLVIGRYDSRLTGPLDPAQTMYDPTKDPSLEDIISDVGVIRYMRNQLQFRTDLRYQGPFGGGYPAATTFRGDWMSVRWNRADLAAEPAATDSVPELQRVMRANPDLRVYAACGYFDLVCNYAVIEYMSAQLEPSLARNVTVRAYAGGHAIYTDPAARLRMKDDVTAFITQAAAAGR